ncbi:MAG: MBL fold metallo-hydrolase [Acidobacteria bacterium]|nr:MBL fold metallo-hydrolase [Acidobacteriota bacterium]
MIPTQGPVTTLDLHFKVPGTVAAFLVRTPAGPVLVETGPESLYGNLEAAVNAQGFAMTDIRHVFVTHIHLDHAGSAWRLARHGAKVYVHPRGAAHLVDPTKLMDSARRIYKDDMDPLWGRMDAIPADQVVALGDGECVDLGGLAMEAIHTPGHAVHHITYRLEDGLFTGDVGGIRIGNGPTIPPLPPPDIDLGTWADSIARMRATGSQFIYPTHFGIKDDAAAHFDSLEENLHRIATWVKERLATGEDEAAMVPPFQAFMHDLLAGYGLPESAIQLYEIADPAFMSVYGLVRYWRKQAGG